MPIMKSSFSLFVLLLITALGAAGEPPSPQPGQVVFREKVRSLLVTKCLVCHSGDKKRGGLDLTRRDAALEGGDNGPAFKPGSARDSLLYEKINARTQGMPPKNPLT